MKHWHLPLRRSARCLRLALPALLATIALPVVAQQRPGNGRLNNPSSVCEDSTEQVQLAVPLDSLAAVPLAPAVDSARLVWLRMPATQRELIGDRMSCFETLAPHQFNNAVLAYINLFTQRQRGYTQRVLEREQFYFPIFEKYLTQYNLPTDLKYLAVVESALIPTAKSPVGATGLWQFMGPTAGDLRLKKDEWVDERMHPEKATEAACKHLRYLYGLFHDWELVLAAYNWGAGSVQRVLRRTGKKTFWDLYPYLPAETRNYVPTFTAIMYTMTYAQQHQLRAPELHYQVAEPLDTLTITGQPIDLRRLSRALGYADSMALQRFNPELRHGGLPAGYRPYVLRYPSAARPNLGDADRPTLLGFCRPAGELAQALLPLPPRLAGIEPFPTRDLLAADGPRADGQEPQRRFRRLRHVVRRGETVARLAERFEVSPAQLRRWNELAKGQALRPGRSLLVFVPLPPGAPATGPAALVTTEVAVALAPAVLPTPRAVPDEAAQRLAAANARYAREAAEATAREKAQAQQLARLQKAEVARLAARAVAEHQRLAIARSVAAAQAAAVAKATHERQRETATVMADSTEETATATEETVTVATKEPEVAVGAATTSRLRPGQRPVASTSLPPPAQPSRDGQFNRSPYVVRRGDNLTRLAHERGLSVVQVTAWNHLQSSEVEAGQRLVFVAPAAGAMASAAPGRPKTSLDTRFHQVQPGDTLYNISRRFNISVQELRKLNRLTTDEVKLGQKLVVQAG